MNWSKEWDSCPQCGAEKCGAALEISPFRMPDGPAYEIQWVAGCEHCDWEPGEAEAEALAGELDDYPTTRSGRASEAHPDCP